MVGDQSGCMGRGGHIGRGGGRCIRCLAGVARVSISVTVGAVSVTSELQYASREKSSHC